jgi:4-phytase/acid phosphatase
VRLLVAACATVAWAAPAAAQELQLERVLLLSRHGVRTPTKPLEELDKHVSTPWARWPDGLQPGDLTPRGAELATLMGGFYRVLYAGRGLLPAAERCPASGTVAAWADVNQRTRLTAQALLDGLYPRCGLKEQHQADTGKDDPLFHPPRDSATCPFDQAEGRAAIMRRIGDFASILRDYAAPLETTQAALCPAEPPPPDKCGLNAEPSEIVSRRDGGLEMKGPIGIGSTAVEIFQLEAAQGMAPDQVAWGRLKDAALSGVMSIHVLQFDLMQRTRYIAQRQGSRLLGTIAATLQDGHAFPAAQRGPQLPRLAILVGHDSNLANVAGLLEIGWAIPGMQPNDPSPGGALAFELLRDARSGQRWIGVTYYAQTLDQMRTTARLDLDRPAGKSVVQLPGCVGQANGALCPLSRFLEIAQAAIDPTCAR